MFKSTKSVGIMVMILLILMVIFIVAWTTSNDSVQTNEYGQMRIVKHPFGIGKNSITPNKQEITNKI
jgi:hypothetical protein